MNRRVIPQMEPNYDLAEAKALNHFFKNGGWGGEYVQTENLEKMICEYTSAKHCSLTVNGTISLTLALLALDIKRGDEILVPDMTMIASPNSATILGIKPIMVDVEPETLCMDLIHAEKLITTKTKALMYVSFNGRSGNMEAVTSFCQKHRLYLIEDSAQALGSFWHGKHLGTFGNLGSFSFSVPKIITTGQGGALITNDIQLYKKIEKIKDFGRTRGGIDIHDVLGWNFKFSDFLAVIGIEQMKKLKKRVKVKKEMYKYYHDNLSDVDGISFLPTNLRDTTPWFMDIYVGNPTKLAKYLMDRGIATRPIYPAVHTQPFIKKVIGKKEKYPVATEFAKRGLWLPSSTKLSRQDLNYIIKSVREFYVPKSINHESNINHSYKK